jgi:phosphatidylethanolamine/phosphatidyl-N-methylethanolamine N-methyltransferase
LRETRLFLGQYARHWRATGAVSPSGRPLARAMADAAGDLGDRPTVVELGPGTGVFTRELVRRFPAGRVVAVEVNPAFADRVERTVPAATVVRGCASELPAHLAAIGVAPSDVAAVVSGLPVLTLPADLTRRVFAAVAAVLPPGRRYVQFTYSARAWRAITVPGFDRLPDRRVWANLPPAVVLTFARTATS